MFFMYLLRRKSWDLSPYLGLLGVLWANFSEIIRAFPFLTKEGTRRSPHHCVRTFSRERSVLSRVYFLSKAVLIVFKNLN